MKVLVFTIRGVKQRHKSKKGMRGFNEAKQSEAE